MCSTEREEEHDDESFWVLKPIHPSGVRGTAGCETWSVAFSPDGSHFAWSMGYGMVKVFDWPLPTDEGECISRCSSKTLKCEHLIWSLAFGPRLSNGAREMGQVSSRADKERLLLATGLDNGSIKVWIVSTGKLLYELRGHESIVRDLAFAPNGSLTLVSASRDKTLRVWDLNKKGKEPHVLVGPTHWIFKCSISPNSSMIASVCNSDSRVYLWSLRSFTFIRYLTYNQPRTMISCDFSADGALLAVGSYDCSSWVVDLWDPYTAEHVASLRDCDMCGYRFENLIRALSFSQEGLRLALVTDQRALQIWDLERDQLFQQYTQRGIDALCCTFHPKGGTIAAGTRDGHVKFWKIPRSVPSLRHLCRFALRFSLSTQQVEVLPLPKKILDFLTYRDVLRHKVLRCNKGCSSP
ncbi:WD repeat and SOCS box-containing protein 2 [Chanos chanos]|uniref:WD repeat and SOCS box-containing protein 2 n=1 Tax=Chanos chanos TaxID=29144 RepID=A0A6J2WSZ9_CHACN|nr:WD repeat and SOCS box-containing protein 2 [Chanos chanos]